MGWNSTVVVMNDALDAIRDDPEFGKKLYHAICEKSMFPERSKLIDVPALNHVNAATVIEQHHADYTAIIAVGGNYGSVLHTTYGWSHHTTEFLERVAKELRETIKLRKQQEAQNT